MQAAPVVELHRVGQLLAHADDVPRGDVRPQPERAGRLRAGAVGHRRDLLQQRRGLAGRPDDAVRRAWPAPACRTCRSCSRTPPCSTRATTPSRRSTSCSRRSGTARAWRRCRPSSGAAASPTRRRRSASPGWFNINSTNDFAISLTKVMGPPHDQDRVLQHAQLQGGADEQQRVRHDQLPAGRRRHQSVRHLVRLRQRRDRHVQLVPAGAEVRRDRVGLQQHRGVHPGQLEGEQPADARLRPALRAPAGAVRHARPGVELPARQVVAGGGAGAVRARLRQRRRIRARARTARRWIRAPASSSGPNSTLAIGTLVPNTGNTLNGLFLPGSGGLPTRRPTSRRRSAVAPALRHGVRRDGRSSASCFAAASGCSSIVRARRRSPAASTTRRRRARSPSSTANCRRSAAAA